MQINEISLNLKNIGSFDKYETNIKINRNKIFLIEKGFEEGKTTILNSIYYSITFNKFVKELLKFGTNNAFVQIKFLPCDINYETKIQKNDINFFTNDEKFNEILSQHTFLINKKNDIFSDFEEKINQNVKILKNLFNKTINLYFNEKIEEIVTLLKEQDIKNKKIKFMNKKDILIKKIDFFKNFDFRIIRNKLKELEKLNEKINELKIKKEEINILEIENKIKNFAKSFIENNKEKNKKHFINQVKEIKDYLIYLNLDKNIIENMDEDFLFYLLETFNFNFKELGEFLLKNKDNLNLFIDFYKKSFFRDEYKKIFNFNDEEQTDNIAKYENDIEYLKNIKMDIEQLIYYKEIVKEEEIKIRKKFDIIKYFEREIISKFIKSGLFNEEHEMIKSIEGVIELKKEFLPKYKKELDEINKELERIQNMEEKKEYLIESFNKTKEEINNYIKMYDKILLEMNKDLNEKDEKILKFNDKIDIIAKYLNNIVSVTNEIIDYFENHKDLENDLITTKKVKGLIFVDDNYQIKNYQNKNDNIYIIGTTLI